MMARPAKATNQVQIPTIFKQAMFKVLGDVLTSYPIIRCGGLGPRTLGDFVIRSYRDPSNAFSITCLRKQFAKWPPTYFDKRWRIADKPSFA